MKYRAIEAHTPDPGAVLIVRQGERLRFTRRPTTWMGWLWCMAEGERTGWVPEDWVVIEGDTCVMQWDYDSTELPVAIGDEFVGDFVESGWMHVRNERGETGWVPARALKQVEPA